MRHIRQLIVINKTPGDDLGASLTVRRKETKSLDDLYIHYTHHSNVIISRCCHTCHRHFYAFPCWLSSWWRNQMETLFSLLALCEGNPPVTLTKASDVHLWCFRWYTPEQTVVQTIETPVIWDAVELIITSLWWYHAKSSRVVLLWFRAGLFCHHEIITCMY